MRRIADYGSLIPRGLYWRATTRIHHSGHLASGNFRTLRKIRMGSVSKFSANETARALRSDLLEDYSEYL